MTMASTGAELGATVNAIFCCKETLKKGLMSGAVGTLQKEGYTEEKRAKIAHALNKSMWMFETNHVSRYCGIIGSLLTFSDRPMHTRMGSTTRLDA